MQEAAGRDRIARQYVTRYDDVFGVGLAALEAATVRGESGMWPTVFAYMAFLAGFPDSHVARIHGAEIAGQVQEEAAAVRASLDAAGDEAARICLLMDFDRSLKERAINPGTSADLTVASLLVHARGSTCIKRALMVEFRLWEQCFHGYLANRSGQSGRCQQG